MRKLFLIISVSFFACTLVQAQELAVGDTLPPLLFEHVFSEGNPDLSAKNIPASGFKGKLLLIDFWATWCGPCIKALSEYEKLQASHKGQLSIVAVSQETPERIRAFLKNRPVHLDMAIDTAGMFQTYFPYRTIPHAVLIDKNGVVRAITHSDEITDSVVKRLIAGKDIKLSLKKDDTQFDYEEDYFKADSNTASSFNLQPGIRGVGTFSKIGKGVFKGRRISMHNFTIDGLYRMAYQVSFFRLQYAMDKKEFEYSNFKNLYCLDVIVPKGHETELYETMKQQLPRFFDIKTRWEKRKMPVYVIKRNDSTLALKASQEKKDEYSGSSNFFTGIGVKISALADYLESFGLLGTPVIDETGVEGRYDLHMEWQPEKKGDLKNVFLANGFLLVKEEREVMILVIFK